MGCVISVVDKNVFIKKEINKKRNRGQKLISSDLIISLNNSEFDSKSVNIHTADIGASYEPDMDFSFPDEFHPVKRKELIEKSLCGLQGVSEVYCNNFFQKVLVCESIDFFSVINEILNDGGRFRITVPDYYAYSDKLLKTKFNQFKSINLIEKAMFSASDSTGLFFNRTIWTFERLSRCLVQKAGFKKIARAPGGRKKYEIAIVAIK